MIDTTPLLRTNEALASRREIPSVSPSAEPIAEVVELVDTLS